MDISVIETASSLKDHGQSMLLSNIYNICMAHILTQRLSQAPGVKTGAKQELGTWQMNISVMEKASSLKDHGQSMLPSNISICMAHILTLRFSQAPGMKSRTTQALGT